MADGSVTIKVDMDGSHAQSGVSKLKNLLGGLENAGSKVGSVFKSVLGANLISGAISTGIGSITGGIREMAGELNSSQKAWKTFEGNLQAFGRSPEVIKAAKTEMQDFATKTIYSASYMASTYAQLDAVGTKNVGSLVKAFGGLAASAENPAQAMKSLSMQATQMASKPKVAWMDFKIMMEQAPAGMAAVAKEMGMSTAELVAAVQDGKVNTEAFFDAMNKAGNSAAFQKMATEFKTVDQAIDGAKESLANRLMPAFEKLNKFGIKVVVALTDAMEQLNFDKFAESLGQVLEAIDVGSVISRIQQAFQLIFNPVFVYHFQSAVENVKGALGALGGAFNSVAGGTKSWILTLSNFLTAVTQTISVGARAVKQFIQSFANTGALQEFKFAVDSIIIAYRTLIGSVGDATIWAILGNKIGQVVRVIAQVIRNITHFLSGLDPNLVKTFTNGIVGAVAAFIAFSAGIKVISSGLKGLSFIKSFNPFSFFKKNATEALTGTTKSISRSKSTFTLLFNGISNLVKSLGQSLKSVFQGLGLAFSGLGKTFEGLGKGLGAVLKGLMQGLKGLNPATLLSFGAAVGVAAVGIGTGIAIIAAGFTLLTSQGQNVAIILQALGGVIVSVGTAIGIILNLALQGLASALVIISPVLPTIASAFAMLPPVIMVAGAAISMIISSFNSLAPVITALGNALSQVISAITSGVAEIATAIVPLVAIIGNVFVQVVQIVSDAIVQIIQSLAPFIPELRAMVEAVAPVLGKLVDAFDHLISQISPIIDNLKDLVKTLGDKIRSILEGTKGVIESFGGVVKTVLDSVAKIFDSLGNAAKNAGEGVKLMAQGVQILVDLNLGDLVGTLAAVATGLGAIAASGISSAGPGLQQAGEGIRWIATSSQLASIALQYLPAALVLLSSSVGQLPPLMTTTANAMRSFATSVLTSFVGLAASTISLSILQSRLFNLQLTLLTTKSGVVTLISSFSSITGVVRNLEGILSLIPIRLKAMFSAALAARGTLLQLANAAPTMALGFSQSASVSIVAMNRLNSTIKTVMTQIVSFLRLSMSQMVFHVRQSATQMTQAGYVAGRGVSKGVKEGIRSGISSAVSTLSSMMAALRSAGIAGIASMHSIGVMMGQGLAEGMYSALGAVTTAANALVVQAERAAQAKAKIHSPSRLFRDEVGRYIAQGIAVGIEENTSDVTDSLAYVQREMSTFRFGVEELLGLSSGSISHQLALKASAEREENNSNSKEQKAQMSHNMEVTIIMEKVELAHDADFEEIGNKLAKDIERKTRGRLGY